MTPDRWQQIEQLYAEALTQEPEQRAAFVAAQAGADTILFEEVASLLAAHAGDPMFLETPFAGVEVLPALLDQVDGVGPGDAIGSYRLVRELGRGGMGTVFLAERHTEAFTQQVALKLLRRGLDTDDLLRRFRAEQRILASLEHPHIARLIDGEATDDGRPYFAMEYVDGEPLTAYCDRRSLSVEARLRLFRQVCAAVQFAHQSLVVHRDLKPSNILVTDEGQVKLLDFGIARLLDPAQGDTLTMAGWRVMTPAYASPEQVRGDAITTATDVYALGVMLYELLTGRRPYDVPQAGAELERILWETEPVRPSVVVTRPAEATREDGTTGTHAPQAVSRARGLEVGRLQRRLRGDLDTIILKALRKAPEARYATVEQLSEDLRRHLAGLPVLARRPTLRYHLGTFVRRHRIGVAAAGIIAVLLIGFSAVMARQAQQIRRQAAEVAQERDKAEEVVQFLVSLFESSDPGQSRGAEMTARTLLERGRSRIDDELVEQPAVQASMRGVMGDVYEALGDYTEAEHLARQALTQQQAVYGEAHADVATALNRLGWVRYLRSDYAAADSLLQAALTMRRVLLGSEHLDVARTMNDLAVVQQARGDYAATDTLLRAALAIRRRQLGPAHQGVATTLNNLAALQWRLGDYSGAITFFDEALAVFRQTLGPDHPRIAITLTNLAVAHLVQGDLDQAEMLYRDALDMRRRLFGSEHPDIAFSLNALANLLIRKHDYAAAEPLLTEALAMRRALLGDEHRDVASTLENLGRLKKETGAYDEADAVLREALAIRRTLVGTVHADVASTMVLLGDVAQARGDREQAAALFQEALGMQRLVLGAAHPDLAITLGHLADVQHENGQPEAAAETYREALSLAHATLPAGHERITTLAAGLSRVLTDLRRFEDAETVLQEAAASIDPTPPAVQTAFVRLYEAWGKPEQVAAWQANVD